jgi:MAF protein
MTLLLASGSPRRRDLISLLGLPFRVIKTDLDESRLPDEPPIKYVTRLSREKAQAARQFATSPSLILAADTAVVDGADVLGKPVDVADARAMLIRLRDRTHTVCTAITLLEPSSGRMITEVVSSPVLMRPYSDSEIEQYIASGDPFDKAGAYAIQHPDFHPVESFDHCYANVMGLPLCHVARMLHSLKSPPSADAPSACQQALGYPCPIWRSVLPPSQKT